jgi:mono/diheme cytochrome c family protein
MCHVGQDPATELATDGPRRPPAFGPLLSKNSAGGDQTRLREKIKNGGPRMPAYKYTLTDEQVDQLVAFMKTVERPLTQLAIARPGE